MWKNKVKKLEKNIEKLKLDCDKLGEQNEFYKSNQNNIHGQFENKSREFSALKEVSSNLEEKSQNLESEVCSIWFIIIVKFMEIIFKFIYFQVKKLKKSIGWLQIPKS